MSYITKGRKMREVTILQCTMAHIVSSVDNKVMPSSQGTNKKLRIEDKDCIDQSTSSESQKFLEGRHAIGGQY